MHLLRWIYDECRLDTEWMTSMDPAIDDRTTPTYPVRLPVWWGMERPHSEDEPIPDSTVRLWHRKQQKGVERRLARWMGAPLMIERPLDTLGSAVWYLSDGKRTLAHICDLLETRFQEDIHPVLERTIAFIHRLEALRLITVRHEPFEDDWPIHAGWMPKDAVGTPPVRFVGSERIPNEAETDPVLP